MAPLLDFGSERNVWTANSEPMMYITASASIATIVLLILACACGGKSKTQQEKEKAADVPPPTEEAADALKASQKSGECKSLLNTSAKGSNRPPSLRGTSQQPKAGVDPKSGRADPKKSLQLTQGAQPSAKSIGKVPTPAETPMQKMLAAGPPPAVKSMLPAPTAPAPVQKNGTPANGDFVFKAPKAEQKTILATMIAPGAPGRQPAPVWEPVKPDMEAVGADDPAYRSLAGLDDAFGPTQMQTVGSVYGGGKTSAESAMPSTVASTTTPLASTSGSSMDASGADKGKVKKSPKQKKKGKK